MGGIPDASAVRMALAFSPVEMQRVVIEFQSGEGPMAGRFFADAVGEPAWFSGWMELLALLEAVRGRQQTTETTTTNREV